jgi:hypothetical protein
VPPATRREGTYALARKGDVVMLCNKVPE